MQCDVADETAVEHFRDEVAAHGGSAHLVINNAGIAGGESFIRAPQEQWDRVFSVN